MPLRKRPYKTRGTFNLTAFLNREEHKAKEYVKNLLEKAKKEKENTSELRKDGNKDEQQHKMAFNRPR